MSLERKRFYREVAVEPPGERGGARGYRILLDGKPLKTPEGDELQLPGYRLAEAVAEEWRGQEEIVRTQTMTLTRLVNTALDRVAKDRPRAVARFLEFAKTDLLCYRAEVPAELAAFQAKKWDPPIRWVREVYGVELKTGSGIAFVEQSEEAILRIASPVEKGDDFVLAGLNAAAQTCGSAILALALMRHRLSAEEAFELAHLDELYQALRWGSDPEAEAARLRKRAELVEIARFFEACRG